MIEGKNEVTQSPSVLLVDGMALLFRGYYGSHPRRTSTGLPTNAIYQWIKYFYSAVEAFGPFTHVVCCWDMGSKTFRNDMYDLYKSNRGAPPEDLIPQFDLIKELVEEGLSISNVGIDGFEADDVIGTLSLLYSEHMNVLILTGDHDNLQLVSDRVKVAIMKKGMGNFKVYCPKVLMEEKGITAKQFIDVKAIMGDTSDQIPGVKGIGEVGALKLIKEYQTIEGILDNMNSLSPAMKKKIEQDEEMLHLSRKLSEIRVDVDHDHQLEHGKWILDKNKARIKFDELELKSLQNLIS